MSIINESYFPPFALLVLDGDDNKWKVYKGMESDEFNKEELLKSLNTQEFPNGTYTNNYIDAKIVPNSNLNDYLSEEVDAGTDSQTEHLYLALEMERTHESASFDYKVEIDDVGQIVFTPSDTATSFVDIRRLAGYDSTSSTEEENVKTFSISLTADMISESANFDWFVDIDEVGQAVITPDAEDSSFLTVAVEESLNLVTEAKDPITLEEDIEPDDPDFEVRKELCLRCIEDLKDLLEDSIKKAERIERYFREIGIHAEDIESYMINYLKSFAEEENRSGAPSVVEFRTRLEEYSNVEPTDKVVEESLEASCNEDITDSTKQQILGRFMRGEMGLFSDEGSPEAAYIPLEELNYADRYARYSYYYDEQSDSVVCYATPKEE